MKNCRDWVFSNGGFEVGLKAFQLPIFEKEICSTWWTSKDPITTRSLRSLRAAACCISSERWWKIMLAKDKVEVSKIWITGYWLRSRLSCIRDCCESMKNCPNSAFSLRGLEAGLWAFQLQMLATCLSKESIPAIPFWNSKHPLPPESRSTLHQLKFVRFTSSSSLQLKKKTCLMQGSKGFGL